ncbi:MAG TPA: isoprenylcysteine carboxylmethyltransferase family protein [Terriglobales bacterium]|nr:isoprenylcysteine carboxylmethyltransferase family protein [Terriglobales bacterium]
MIQLLHWLGWIAAVIYSTIPSFWLIIHPRAEYWRAQRRSPYRVLVPYWISLWIVVGWITWRWRSVELYRSPWTWIPAVALFVAGLSLYMLASNKFTPAQLGGVPEVQRGRRDQRLVTTGIRGHVRHPVYLGHLCEMLAWSLGTGLLVCYALTVFAMVSGAIMIRMEDDELDQRFGEEYRAYRESVPAVIPARSRYNPKRVESQ